MANPIHMPGGTSANKPTLVAREFYYATDTGIVYLGNPGGTEFAIQIGTDYVTKALYNANTILTADTDNTPAALAVAANSIIGRVGSGSIDDIAVAASRIVGRTAAGDLAALTTAEVATLLGYQTVRSPIERFIAGNLYVANSASDFFHVIYFSTACTIANIVCGCVTAPTGANLIMNFLYHESAPASAQTIYSTGPLANAPTIAAGAYESGASNVPDTKAMAAGSFLLVCLSQVGSTIAGADLAYTITFE